MAKADLHVHSIYSERPSNWFLQRIGASESYTDPDFIFKTAMDKGLDFVTVTDHNRLDASMYLKEKYPDKVFTGVESTTYFPDDNCKIHILLYGIDEQQFAEVQKIRTDIYQLREFIRESNIAYSVAHATYSINGKISVEKLEKLILLFDVFEGINGGRGKVNNSVWTAMLKSLKPSHIEEMYAKHRIDPFGTTPWIKSFTGGSDDHAGLFIGKAYTFAEASTPEDFLDSLRSRGTRAEGQHNDYKSLAFTIYKIAYDFSMSSRSSLRLSSLARLGEAVLKKRINNDFPGNTPEENTENAQIRLLLSALADDIASRESETDTEIWLERVYDRITSVSDEFFRNILLSIIADTKKGDFNNFIKNISSMLPGIFLSLPFFMTLKHINDSRDLLDSLKKKYIDTKPRSKKILWFTDTFHEMNGVASTLREIAQISDEQGKSIKVVTALSKKTKTSGGNSDSGPEPIPDFAPNSAPNSLVDLSYFLDFNLPYYENIEIRIPSLLACVKKLGSQEVDEIYISTPGPVGIIGAILSRLLSVKCTGIYHTDFAAQAVEITGNESLYGSIESYIRSFYSFMDEILVPTSEYIDILSKRGFEKSKMKIFLRAVNTRVFAPAINTCGYIERNYGIKSARTLLYAGRVSNDKGIDMIVEIHQRLFAEDSRINLLIVGDGPYLDEIKEKCADKKGIVFTGALDRKDLPTIYSACDLLVFPSITDTFGMVVLEAQSCGLPAFVSDIGGPKEIVVDGGSGKILPAGKTSVWVNAIKGYFEVMEYEPQRHAAMKVFARRRAFDFGWDSALAGIFGEKETESNLDKTDVMKIDFSKYGAGAKPAA